MDIKCPKCGEPWGMDTCHEVAKEDGTTFDEVYADFRAVGCRALGATHNGNSANPAIGELADLLGDDMDGFASMLEDFGL